MADYNPTQKELEFLEWTRLNDTKEQYLFLKRWLRHRSLASMREIVQKQEAQ